MFCLYFTMGVILFAGGLLPAQNLPPCDQEMLQTAHTHYTE